MLDHKIKSGIGILIIIGLFILSSYFIQSNLGDIQRFMDFGFFSIVIYIIILVIAGVIAPINLAPLMPVAVGIWGWFLAAIFTIIGWAIGALIAFLLARKYGVPLIKKFASLDEIHKLEKLVPEHHVFLGIVFLRLSVPVDLWNYIFGLFSNIKIRTYFFASLIAFTPLAFLISYVGALSFTFQIIAFGVAILMFFLGYLAWRHSQKRKVKKLSTK